MSCVGLVGTRRESLVDVSTDSDNFLFKAVSLATFDEIPCVAESGIDEELFVL